MTSVIGNPLKRKLKRLTEDMQACQICVGKFSHKPHPIFQICTTATILIAGQAPGRKVHETGIPFNDPSGDRLREWMGLSKNEFYDKRSVAILPMGFCYPGQGKGGDLPPRTECAQAWRAEVLGLMPNVQLTLVIGRYAMKWHLGELMKNNLTETVKAWPSFAPTIIPLPHPSPRNNRWLKKNDWFENNVIPELRKRVQACSIR